jgi:ADP-ribose pyrophosphatase YjhB (NUDIX family)
MDRTLELLTLAKRVQAVAENGLHFSESDWDLDRYQDLENIALHMLSLISQQPLELVEVATPERHGYRTPKIDVRAVLFNEQGELLFVKERVDGRWSLPGGWCDVGFTPREVAEKEAFEEAGIKCRAGRLIAVLDKKCHEHPMDLHYVYKIFLECTADNYRIAPGMETLDVGYFGRDALPDLSIPRNTTAQIMSMFDYHDGNITWPLLD